jgi:PAS domain S-box-containing protein
MKKFKLHKLSITAELHYLKIIIGFLWIMVLGGFAYIIDYSAKQEPQTTFVLIYLWIVGLISTGIISIYIKKRHTKYVAISQALLTSEERLNNYFRNVPNAIFIINANGDYIDINPAACELVGYTREELLKLNIKNLLAPESLEQGKSSRQNLISTGSSKSELFLLRKDGSKVFTSINSTQLPGNKYIGYCSDITWQNKAEEALLQAKEYAENLIQTANALVIVLDDKGNIQTFNKAAEIATGYTLSELKGKNWFEIIVPKEKYPLVWHAFNKLINNELPKNFENPILTKSGTERYIIWQNNEIRKNDSIVGSISFGIDITDRKIAEEALKESETLLTAIINNVPIIMLLVDENAKVLKINQTGLNLTPHREKEIIGLNSGDVLNCINRLDDPRGCGFGAHCQACNIRNTLTRTIQSGVSYFKVEGLMHMEDSNGTSTLNVLISSEIIKISGKTRVLVSIEDITKRKQVELELQKHRERLEELVEERTFELQKEIDAHKQTEYELQKHTEDLVRFNREMINREIRILEMKKEVNYLCKELGKSPAYEAFWEDKS